MTLIPSDIEIGDPFARWSCEQHTQHERAEEAKGRIRAVLAELREILETVEEDVALVEAFPDADDGVRATVADLLLDHGHQMSGRA